MDRFARNSACPAAAAVASLVLLATSAVTLPLLLAAGAPAHGAGARLTPLGEPAGASPPGSGASGERPGDGAGATGERPGDEPVGSPRAYGVSAADPHAVEAGMRVLAAGGNAVDAAVAAAYAVAVVEPFASGIGGGGAAIVVAPGEPPVTYDYRDELRRSGQIPPGNVGIPGFVAGMERLAADYGSMDLADLVAPAIRLAAEGVPATGFLADQLRTGAGKLPGGRLPHFFPGGRALDRGDLLVQDELAGTLRAIALRGASTFYDGELAEHLSSGVNGIDLESLAAYEVRHLEPVSGTFAGYEVHSSAPPLPGAVLVQMLQVAEALGVEGYEPGSADFVHALAMAWRVGDRSRLDHLGDPEFVDVPVDVLTDAGANAGIAGGIAMHGQLAGAAHRAGGVFASNTTHVTTVDDDGLVVSMTNTLSNFWGSGQYALGFFLNDQLRNFDRGPNAAAPGKRTRAYSAPTVVLDADGRPVLALGSPGGRRIPNMLAQVLVRWALHGQPVEEAVTAPRFHGEGRGLEFEELPPGPVASDLRSRGYTSLGVPAFPYYFGSVQAVEIDYEAGELRSAADPRREGGWRVEARRDRPYGAR